MASPPRPHLAGGSQRTPGPASHSSQTARSASTKRAEGELPPTQPPRATHGKGAPYLGIGALGDLPQVILSPSGDLPKEQLFSHPATQHHAHAVKELLPRVEVLLTGKVLGVPKSLAPGDDGHLQERGHKLVSPPAAPQCSPDTLSQPWPGALPLQVGEESPVPEPTADRKGRPEKYTGPAQGLSSRSCSGNL